MMWFAAGYFSAGIIAKPNGTAHPLIAPYETFTCSDGDIAIGGANQSNWERIAKLLGHEEWIEDKRFIDGATRLAKNLSSETRGLPGLVRDWATCESGDNGR